MFEENFSMLKEEAPSKKTTFGRKSTIAVSTPKLFGTPSKSTAIPSSSFKSDKKRKKAEAKKKDFI